MRLFYINICISIFSSFPSFVQPFFPSHLYVIEGCVSLTSFIHIVLALKLLYFIFLSRRNISQKYVRMFKTFLSIVLASVDLYHQLGCAIRKKTNNVALFLFLSFVGDGKTTISHSFKGFLTCLSDENFTIYDLIPD